MKQRWICLLLACVLPLTLMAGCEDKDAEEMTAVTLTTLEATEAIETTAETQATEEKRTQPVQVTETPTEIVTESSTQVVSEVTLSPVTEAQPATEAETQTEPDLRAIAVYCIGSPVSALYALIGYPPNGSAYTVVQKINDDSVLAEEGVLYYNGFTVYTYRENGDETVVGVN